MKRNILLLLLFTSIFSMNAQNLGFTVQLFIHGENETDGEINLEFENSEHLEEMDFLELLTDILANYKDKEVTFKFAVINPKQTTINHILYDCDVATQITLTYLGEYLPYYVQKTKGAMVALTK